MFNRRIALACVSLILFAAPAWCIDFIQTRASVRGEVVKPIYATPFDLYGLAVAERNGEDHLYVMRYSRDNNGLFSQHGVSATYALPALLSESALSNYSLLDAQRYAESKVALVSACDGAGCRYYAISLDAGNAPSSFVELPEPACSEAPVLINQSEVFICGKVSLFDGSSSRELKGELLSSSDSAEGKAYVFWQGDDVVWTDGVDEETLFSVTGVDDVICDIAHHRSSWHYFCAAGVVSVGNDPSMWNYTIYQGVKGGQVFFSERPDLSPLLSFLSAHYYEDHALINFSSGEMRIIENWTLDGKRYSTREVKTTISDDKPRWLASDTPYVVFDVVRGVGQDAVVVFDGLPTIGLPQLAESFVSGSQTGRDYSVNILVQDESVLPENIKITWSSLPDFLNWDESSRTLSGYVAHRNAGDHPFDLILQGASDDVRALELNFTAVLTPADVEVFEPTLFERWELEDPVSLIALRDVESLEFLEDQAVAWQFNKIERDDEDLLLEVTSDLPTWLMWDPENLTLSGTPGQDHVGEYVVTLRARDVYDPERDMSYSLPIQIIEVDERFVVVSNGNATLKAGDNYQYELKIVDEETPMVEMGIEVVYKPDWLMWNDATFTLSGVVPADAKPGTVLVQFIIRDDAGHTALHQASITIESETEESAGGALHLWFILGLALLLLRRMR